MNYLKLYEKISRSKLIKVFIAALLVLLLIPAAGLKQAVSNAIPQSDNVEIADDNEVVIQAESEETAFDQSADAEQSEIYTNTVAPVAESPAQTTTNASFEVTIDWCGGRYVDGKTLPEGWTKVEVRTSEHDATKYYAKKTFSNPVSVDDLQTDWKNQICFEKDVVVAGISHKCTYNSIDTKDIETISSDTTLEALWEYTTTFKAFSEDLTYNNVESPGEKLAEIKTKNYTKAEFKAQRNRFSGNQVCLYRLYLGSEIIDQGSIHANEADSSNLWSCWQLRGFKDDGGVIYKELNISTWTECTNFGYISIDELVHISTTCGPNGKIDREYMDVTRGSKVSLDENNNFISTFTRFNEEETGIPPEISTIVATPETGYKAYYFYDVQDPVLKSFNLDVRFYSNTIKLLPSVAQGQSSMGSVNVDGDKSLTRSKNITWNYDGEKVVVDNNGTKTTISYQLSDSDRYAFDGWEVKTYDAASEPGSKVEEDLYIIAHFKYKKCTVIMDLGGGSITSDQQTILRGKGWTKNGGIYIKDFDSGTGKETVLADWAGIVPTKEHYSFDYWQGDYEVLKDVTYSANYKPDLYELTAGVEELSGEKPGTAIISGLSKVTYGMNSYKVTDNKITFTDTSEAKDGTAEATAYDGFKFKCWKINGEEVTSGAKGEFDGDTTLTAVFEYDTVDVTFNLLYWDEIPKTNGWVEYNDKKHYDNFTVQIIQGSTYEVSGEEFAPHTITFKNEHSDDVIVKLYIETSVQLVVSGFWRDAVGNILEVGSEGSINADTSFKATFYDHTSAYTVYSVSNDSNKGTVSQDPLLPGFKGNAKWKKNDWSETGPNTLTITDDYGNSAIITATAKSGYSFICWAIDGVYLKGTEGLIGGNTTFTAYFAKVSTATVKTETTGIGSVEPTSFKFPTSESNVYYKVNSEDNNLYVYLKDAKNKIFWNQEVTTTTGSGEWFDGFKLGGSLLTPDQEYTGLAGSPEFVACFHNAYTVTVNIGDGAHLSSKGRPSGWEALTETTFTKTFTKGTSYSTIQNEWKDYAPLKEGSTFSSWNMSPAGTTLISDATMTALYSENSYNLNIVSHFEGKSQTATTTYTHKFNEQYSHNVKTITGYTPDKTIIEGTMPSKDVTVNVYYALNVHTLTVKYVCSDTGLEIADAYTNEEKFGSTYKVESPFVKGYTVKTGQEAIEGTMIDEDVNVTVEYTINKFKMTFRVSQPTGTTETFGEITTKELVVWYGTTYSINEEEITFSFPECYPGEKEQVVCAVPKNHGVFIDWDTISSNPQNSAEVYEDIDFKANFEEGYLVQGKVIDADSADPIDGATVYFKYLNTKMKDRVIYAVTDENGVYALPAILKNTESSNDVNATTDPTLGFVYVVAPGYESGVYDNIEVYRDCNPDEYVSTIELKVYSGTFIMEESEGGNGIAIDYKSSSKIEKHGTYSEPIKIGACQGEDVTCQWNMDADKIIVEYADDSAPEKYVDNTTFTAQPKDGYAFDHWDVSVEEPTANTTKESSATSGNVEVDTTYTFKANYKYVGGTGGDEPGSNVTSTGATSDNSFAGGLVAFCICALGAIGFAFSRKKANSS